MLCFFYIQFATGLYAATFSYTLSTAQKDALKSVVAQRFSLRYRFCHNSTRPLRPLFPLPSAMWRVKGLKAAEDKAHTHLESGVSIRTLV